MSDMNPIYEATQMLRAHAEAMNVQAKATQALSDAWQAFASAAGLEMEHPTPTPQRTHITLPNGESLPISDIRSVSALPPDGTPEGAWTVYIQRRNGTVSQYPATSRDGACDMARQIGSLIGSHFIHE